jgi:hypothetical protein
VPPVGQSINVTVQDASWAVANEMVYVEDAGGAGVSAPMRITAINGNVITLLNPSSASGGGVPEAPLDGNIYARLNGAWSRTILQSGTGAQAAVYDINGAPTLTGYVTPTSPAAAYLQIQPKRSSDGTTADGGSITLNGPTNTVGPGQVILAAGSGGTFKKFIADPSGSLILPQDPVNPTDAVTKQYADKMRAVSADAGNLAQLGSDNLVLVPQSSIWSVRLRSFNAIGNSSFEVDQRNVGNSYTPTAAVPAMIDRWSRTPITTAVLMCSGQQVSGNVAVPGTNFFISSKSLLITLTTAAASLSATDAWGIAQSIEGPRLRELLGDVHSVSLLVKTNVTGGLKFGLSLRDNGGAYSLVKLCTIPAPNVWTLITLPNLPIWTASGTFPVTPGAYGYSLVMTLAAGSNYMTSANDAWVAGNFLGAIGQDNFGAKPLNSTFQVAFVQHEPGAICTTLIDKPFAQNYDECLRYYQKSYNYAVATGAATGAGFVIMLTSINANPYYPVRFHKPLATNPTMAGWSPFNGQANTVYDTGRASNIAINSFQSPGMTGFGGVALASQNPAVTNYELHYTADTGW